MRFPHNPRASDDNFESIPSGEPWKTWGIGLLCGVAAMGYGIRAIVTQTAVLYGNRGASLDLVGRPAVAEGTALIGVGVLLFSHYFVQNWRPMAWYVVLGKIAGLTAIIVGLGYLLVRL